MQAPARLQLLGLGPKPNKREMASAADRCGLRPQRLEELLHPQARPLDHELRLLAESLHVLEDQVRLAFGAIDGDLLDRLLRNAHLLLPLVGDRKAGPEPTPMLKPALRTELGTLYQADCLQFLSQVPDESVDLVFADPPFNLKKIYESGIDDDLSERDYLDWTERWIDECCRVLKPGGSLFIWNIPKWCTYICGMLNGRLNFRHWIAADIKYSLPISGRLYPSHYGLLYYVKGRAPTVFSPDRMPMTTCPSCGVEYKDYGGYKSKMNPLGINLGDVWTDISPVRHSKHKKRKDANELPIKLLDRIIEMATSPGQLVLDPFGGAGTTYAVAEIKGRRWMGSEIGSVDQIVERLADLSDEKLRLDTMREKYNKLFPDEVQALRISRGLWTCEDFHEPRRPTLTKTGSLFSK